jgi:hypothetical protein
MKNPSALVSMTTRRAALAAAPHAQATFNQLIDAMVDHYASWRDECVAVRLSYENWSGAERQDRKLAFSAYVAALDREQTAAASYRRAAEQIALA